MSSYSLGHQVLGNLGNLVYWLYVINLPVGPVWILQGFFTLASASMLFCYLRYEKKWLRRKIQIEVDRQPEKTVPIFAGK